ncbi:unnamed protein product [Debaryomyces tyrocola]|nr:unnamed protein product [Debaryomyces tyrocola]
MAPSKVNKTTIPVSVWACSGSTQLQGIVMELDTPLEDLATRLSPHSAGCDRVISHNPVGLRVNLMGTRPVDSSSKENY